MAQQGNYDLQSALNKRDPAFARAGLGDMLAALIKGVNGLAARMDAAGGAATAGTITLTVGGTITAGDTWSVAIVNANIPAMVSPGVTVAGTVVTGDTTTTVAARLAAAINANTTLQAYGITATPAAAVVTTSQGGLIANSTTFTASVTGTITVTRSAASPVNGVGYLGKGNVSVYGNIPTLASKS